ncbi:Uncharacterized protein GBIM_06500 [Gryllus bimaculatus]|nr:Uncharacterized protein GBIM_06500 [Gryllus bimaculatus]
MEGQASPMVPMLITLCALAAPAAQAPSAPTISLESHQYFANQTYSWRQFACTEAERRCLGERRLLHEADGQCYAAGARGPCADGQLFFAEKREAARKGGHLRGTCANRCAGDARPVAATGDCLTRAQNEKPANHPMLRYFTDKSYLEREFPCTDAEKECLQYGRVLQSDGKCYIPGEWSNRCEPGQVFHIDYNEMVTNGRLQGTCRSPCGMLKYPQQATGICADYSTMSNVCRWEWGLHPEQNLFGQMSCACAWSPSTPRPPPPAPPAPASAPGLCRVPDFSNPTVGFLVPCSEEEFACLREGRVLAGGACHALRTQGPCADGEELVLDKHALAHARLQAVCKARPCPEGSICREDLYLRPALDSFGQWVVDKETSNHPMLEFFTNTTYQDREYPCTEEEKACLQYGRILHSNGNCYVPGQSMVLCDGQMYHLDWEEAKNGRLVGTCNSTCTGYRQPNVASGDCENYNTMMEVCRWEWGMQTQQNEFGQMACQCAWPPGLRRKRPTLPPPASGPGLCRAPDFSNPVRPPTYDMTLTVGFLVPCSEEEFACLREGRVLAGGACHALRTQGPCADGEELVLDKHALAHARLQAVCKARPCPEGSVLMPIDGQCLTHQQVVARLCEGQKVALDEFGGWQCDFQGDFPANLSAVVRHDSDGSCELPDKYSVYPGNPIHPLYSAGNDSSNSSSEPDESVENNTLWVVTMVAVPSLASSHLELELHRYFVNETFTQRQFPCSEEELECFKNLQLLFEADGKCYSVGEQGPCAEGEVFHADKLEASRKGGHIRGTCSSGCGDASKFPVGATGECLTREEVEAKISNKETSNHPLFEFFTNTTYRDHEYPCTEEEKVCLQYGRILHSDGNCYVPGQWNTVCDGQIFYLDWDEAMNGRLKGTCNSTFADNQHPSVFNGGCEPPRTIFDMCKWEWGMQAQHNEFGQMACQCVGATGSYSTAPPSLPPPASGPGLCRVPDFSNPVRPPTYDMTLICREDLYLRPALDAFGQWMCDWVEFPCHVEGWGKPSKGQYDLKEYNGLCFSPDILRNWRGEENVTVVARLCEGQMVALDEFSGWQCDFQGDFPANLSAVVRHDTDGSCELPDKNSG